MKGKEMLVTNSDLVLKQEERIVKLFIMFKDKKYGTKYVIFADKENKTLFYGSPLLNGKKMVIMKFKNIKDAEMVKEFVWKYLNNESIGNFELIEIPDIERLEIIDSNSLDVKDEYLEKLKNIFFGNEEVPKKKEEVVEEVKVETPVKKKSKVAKIMALAFVFAIIFGGLYIYTHPELIYGENMYYECTKNYIPDNLDAKANETVTLVFNNSNLLRSHQRLIVYKFNDNDKYYNFKEYDLQKEYVNEEGNITYIDEDLEYRININYTSSKDMTRNYDELLDYYESNEYDCSIVENKK